MKNELEPTTTAFNSAPHTQDNPWRTFGIVIITMVITLGVGYWMFSVYLFPSSFSPVALNEKDQQRLEQKIERLGGRTSRTTQSNERLQPEKYSEEGASREVSFSEKELNSLIAGSNKELATRLAIDLSDNVASARLLVPVDQDAPFLAGKTIKVSAGVELAYTNGKPVVILKGVSLWGVPIPNAWLGNIKNVDLVKEFGSDEGFWKAFSGGVELIEVREGQLTVILKE